MVYSEICSDIDQDRQKEQATWFFKRCTFNEELHYKSLVAHSKRTNYSYKIKELQLQLFDRILALLHRHCTDNQIQVTKMYYLEGKIMPDIAKELGRNYTAIYYCINGSTVYYKKGVKTTPRGYTEKVPKGYTSGGVIKKLKNVALKDEICLDLLWRIRRIDQNEF